MISTAKAREYRVQEKKKEDISHTAMTQFLEFGSGIPPMPEVIILPKLCFQSLVC
jgi:hypothetical protein